MGFSQQAGDTQSILKLLCESLLKKFFFIIFIYNHNFSRSALIWKKTGDKSSQLVRGSFLSKYFLQNAYFKSETYPYPKGKHNGAIGPKYASSENDN